MGQRQEKLCTDAVSSKEIIDNRRNYLQINYVCNTIVIKKIFIMSTEPTSLRLDAKAKRQAYTVFEAVGLKPTQAINLFLRQVALRGGLPFDVKIPNEETIEAMAALEAGKGKRYSTSEEMFKDLDI